MTCQNCKLFRKMAADLMTERDEARAELDGFSTAINDLNEGLLKLEAENHRLSKALAYYADGGDMDVARLALEPQP